MRTILPIVFVVLIIALLICAVIARRSERAIGTSVALLLGALVPPVAGNLIIIVSQSPELSVIGCLFYFIGMNYVMFALLRFTLKYCQISVKRRKYLWIAYIFLIVDTVSLLLNLHFGHAFTFEQLTVSGAPFYRFVPLWGQSIHRLIDYGIFFAVLIIFFVKMIRSHRVYLEKYAVIFATMILVGLWQTFYIFSRTPLDRSMIGFGVFGLLVFFFSIYYRPLRLLDRLLVSMSSELPDAVLFFDVNGLCIWANSKGASLLNLPESQFEKASDRLTELFGEPENRMGDWSRQQTIRKNGNERHYYLQKKTVFDDKNRLAGSFLSIRDNTKETIELQKERYNATHDRTTDLYNKVYLYEMIRKTLDENPDKKWCISVASVDEFEVITDIYGNAFGEVALKQISDWLLIEMPEGSIYGRIGETEFGACVPVDGFDYDHLQNVLSHSVVRAENVEQHVFIHFGVYQITEPELDISVMFDRAKLALSVVRDDLKQAVGFYQESLRDKILWNHQISADLPVALEEHQIIPYLQAIMDKNGRLVGAEVLARWVHPKEGFLMPASFIPIFEKNGLIVELDRYMWQCACEIIKGWEQDGLDLFLSINISPKDFDVVDVEAEIKNLVYKYGIRPEHLRLEITESAILNDEVTVVKILQDLRKEGFLIEMDDFGSGYSSMNLLKDLPLDLVKLDMVFLNSKNVEKAKTVVQSILAMTQQLGLLSLMEGVETNRQYENLMNMGCQFFQGYYFSKPVSVEEFREEQVEQKSRS